MGEILGYGLLFIGVFLLAFRFINGWRWTDDGWKWR